MFSKTVTGLINGISKQPAPMRLSSQGQEQVNCISDPAKGVKRRPGLEHLWETVALPKQPHPTDDVYHWIDRDVDSRFVVWIAKGEQIPDGPIDNPTIRVINVQTGQVITPVVDPVEQFAVFDYLNFGTENTPISKVLRLLSIGDLTYIANTNVVPAMIPIFDNNPTGLWALGIVKTGLADVPYTLSAGVANKFTAQGDAVGTIPTAPNFARVFAGRLKGIPTGAGSYMGFPTDTWDGNLPVREASGPIPTTVPAVGFNADRVFTVHRKNSAPLGPLSFGDGWGDGDTQLLRDGDTVQAFTQLPSRCADGLRIKVDGDPDVNVDSYYVKFVTDPDADAFLIIANPEPPGLVRPRYGPGHWEETVRWGVDQALDPAYMPMALRRVDDTTWTLGFNAWTEREVGDDDTAPVPPFVGQTIEDLAFFKDRLAIVTGESIVFSAVGEYGAFFPSTVSTLVDDDPFDVTANFPEIAKLRFATPFFDTLVLFSDSGIFGVQGAEDAFTAKSLSFTKLAAFTGGVTTRPALAGDRIFFSEIQDGKSVVHEFTRGDGDTPFRSEPVSAHVSGYISAGIDEMTVDANTQTLMVLAGGDQRPVLWVYDWFTSGKEKVQSSWHRWNIGSSFFDQSGASGFLVQDSLRPAGVRFLDGDLYVIQTWSSAQASANKLLMGRVPTNPAPDSRLAVWTNGRPAAPSYANRQIPYIDHWEVTSAFSAAYNSVTDMTSITFESNARLLDLLLTTSGLGSSAINSFFVIVQAQNTTNTNANAGRQLILTGGAAFAPTSVVTIDVAGFVEGGADKPSLLLGVSMRSLYEFSPPTQRGQDNTPILGGKTLMKRMVALFEEPSTVKYYVGTPVIDTQGVGPDSTLTPGLSVSKTEAVIPVHRWASEKPLGVGIFSDAGVQDFTLFGVVHEILANIRHGARIS